jgi:hypothetical protein
VERARALERADAEFERMAAQQPQPSPPLELQHSEATLETLKALSSESDALDQICSGILYQASEQICGEGRGGLFRVVTPPDEEKRILGAFRALWGAHIADVLAAAAQVEPERDQEQVWEFMLEAAEELMEQVRLVGPNSGYVHVCLGVGCSCEVYALQERPPHLGCMLI